jgi:EAL domain-containing protein (putative c-di-GMP-specific phosphodiesterase class I)
MVDEVGIRYAVFGELRMRSVFVPVFVARRGAIYPVGVGAIDALHRTGRSVAALDSSEGADARDRGRLRRVFNRLHIHNLQNAADLALDLQLMPGTADDEGSAVAEELWQLLREAEAAGIDPGRLIFDLTSLSGRDAGALAECARMIRDTGARLILEAGATSLLGLSPQLCPDIVRLPAAWFRQLCREQAGGRLLATMVAGLRRRGIDVQVEGVDSTPQLRLAIEAKVSRFSGDLLGEATLAGAAFPDEPQTISSLLGTASNVIALRSI